MGKALCFFKNACNLDRFLGMLVISDCIKKWSVLNGGKKYFRSKDLSDFASLAGEDITDEFLESAFQCIVDENGNITKNPSGGEIRKRLAENKETPSVVEMEFV